MGKLKTAYLEAEESRSAEFQDALAHFDYYKLAKLTYEANASMEE